MTVTVAAILSEFERRGVTAQIEGENLALQPKRALDDTLLAQVRALKPEIIAALRQGDPLLAKALHDPAVQKVLTLFDAEIEGVEPWTEPPGRIDGRGQRVLTTKDLPAAVAQLRAHGWDIRKGKRNELICTVPRPKVKAPESGASGLADVKLPTERCRLCHSWVFWIGVGRIAICSTCHPPANPSLVDQWYWLPEGEQRQTQ